MQQLGSLVFCIEKTIKLRELEASSTPAFSLQNNSAASSQHTPADPVQDAELLSQAKREVNLQVKEGLMKAEEIAWLEEVNCDPATSLQHEFSDKLFPVSYRSRVFCMTCTRAGRPGQNIFYDRAMYSTENLCKNCN